MITEPAFKFVVSLPAVVVRSPFQERQVPALAPLHKVDKSRTQGSLGNASCWLGLLNPSALFAAEVLDHSTFFHVFLQLETLASLDSLGYRVFTVQLTGHELRLLA